MQTVHSGPPGRERGPTLVHDIAATAASGTPQGLTVAAGGPGPDTSLSWPDLHGRARRNATVLRRSVRSPRPVVAVLADTDADTVAAVQGIWLAGGAVTMLPMPVGTDTDAYLDHLERLIVDSGAELVLLGSSFGWVAPGVPAGTPLRDLADVAAGAAGAAPLELELPSPGDLALLQYSSGSTGTPRGVPVTHGHLAANVAAIITATRHGQDEHGPLLSWLPLYHDMGFIGYLALPMSCGCPLVLMSPLDFARRPARWLEAVTWYRPASTAAPNFIYGLAARLLGAREDLDLSSLRVLITGSEPVDPATMDSFTAAATRHGLDPSAVVPAYGLAESTLAVTFSPSGHGLRVDTVDAARIDRDGVASPAADGRGRQLTRLGPPVPGTELRITGPEGQPLPERRVGRIEVRGASVVGHYRGTPPPAAGSWFDTGDLGYLAEGDLVVCGRAKDVILAAGRTIYPQDIETAAASVPAVRPGRATAFGAGDDGVSGREPGLAVAVEVRSGAPQHELDQVVPAVRRAVLASAGLTPQVVIVLPPDTLPRTSSGKLRRAETRRRFLTGDLPAMAPEPGVDAS